MLALHPLSFGDSLNTHQSEVIIFDIRYWGVTVGFPGYIVLVVLHFILATFYLLRNSGYPKKGSVRPALSRQKLTVMRERLPLLSRLFNLVLPFNRRTRSLFLISNLRRMVFTPFQSFAQRLIDLVVSDLRSLHLPLNDTYHLTSFLM